ncbi:hypothetical protein O2K51_07370 [Apibacter raozihei]|uniref:type II restriction enzyme n=1 Tax=Apibacter raozihei TaxID=2500547 RepID=UPI000FE2E0A6|nr:transcriptional regulator [Apibacter raozihei]
MNESKNESAWIKIFEKYKILERLSEESCIEISSLEINEFREARLMTKFDHRSQLPKLFKNNNLSILPISRGNYIIGTFETFHPFAKNQKIITENIKFPPLLESLNYENITSEAAAINCAYISGILQDFTEDDKLMPTVSGRMSSSCFDFIIDHSAGKLPVHVDNSQLEIDGGYEGRNNLYLLEAKNYLSDDFLIRQLYYPFRLWQKKISKSIVPLFLTYSNGFFHLREYFFNETEHYNSLELIREKKYTLKNKQIDRETIILIAEQISLIEEPEIPFPQADNFERIINLGELLKVREFLTKEEITENYDFDPRQTDYYINAGKYLGILQYTQRKGQNGCTLTEKGNNVYSLSLYNRQLEFSKLILRHKIFNQTIKNYFKHKTLDRNLVILLMKDCLLFNIRSENTYHRRASTIINWTQWIIALTESSSQTYTLFDME